MALRNMLAVWFQPTGYSTGNSLLTAHETYAPQGFSEGDDAWPASCIIWRTCVCFDPAPGKSATTKLESPACITTSFQMNLSAPRWLLVLFGVLRVIGAVMGAQHGWRMSTVTRCFIGAAVLFCLPQLLDVLLSSPMSHRAFIELEGKAIGCALALFCAPIVSHKLGYE
jgi:hypothetical protein